MAPVESAFASGLRVSVMLCGVGLVLSLHVRAPLIEPLRSGIGMMTVRLEVGGYGSSRTR